MIMNSDYLVIGTGIAGLTFALKMAEKGTVNIVTKKISWESNTNYAQGGIAAVVAENDSFDLHIQDTIRTGQGLCHENAVRILVESGPLMIRELMDFGARFTIGDDSMFDLGREGGHSRRRIVHANDLTGAEIETALIQSVKASPNIMVFENHMAVDLMTKAKLFPDITMAGSDDDACIGAYVIESENGKITLIYSL